MCDNIVVKWLFHCNGHALIVMCVLIASINLLYSDAANLSVYVTSSHLDQADWSQN